MELFINILKKNERTRDIIEDQEILSNIIKKLNDDSMNNLYQFNQYLEEECALPPKVIAEVVYQVMNSINYNAKLDSKVVHLWLLFKLYQDLDILKNIKGSHQNKIKRQKVAEVFTSLNFNHQSFKPQIFDHSLKEKVENIIQKYFRNIYSKTYTHTIEKNYEGMKQNLNVLKKLINFCNKSWLLNKQIINNFTSKLGDVRVQLTAQIDTCFTFIMDKIMNPTKLITEEITKQANIRINKIKIIASLNFLNQSTQIAKKLESEMDKVKIKCQKLFSQVYDQRFIFKGQLRSPNQIIKHDDCKQQLSNLMRIGNIKSSIQQMYSQHKLKATQYLQENMRILINWNANFQNYGKDEFLKELLNIRKTIMVIQQCCNIVDDPNDSLRIVENAESLFGEYLDQELKKLKPLKINLNTVNEQILKQIQQWHSKIQIYDVATQTKIKNSKLISKINVLRRQIQQKIVIPLQVFKKVLINELKHKHYKIIFSCQVLQNFGLLATKLKDIIDQYRFQKIREPIELIEKTIKEKCTQIKKDAGHIFDLEYQNRYSTTFIEDTLKTLFDLHHTKPIFCGYLASKYGCLIENQITGIYNQIQILKFKLQFDPPCFQFENNQENFLKCVNIQRLCQMWNTKGYNYGFKQLYTKILTDKFKKKISKIMHSLDCYNLQNINEDISSFRPIQSSVLRLVYMEYKKYPIKGQSSSIRKLSQYNECQKDILKEIIQQNDYIEQKKKTGDFSTLRPTQIISILLEGIQKQIKQSRGEKIIAKVSNNIILNQQCLRNFFRMSEKAMNDGDTQFHKRWVMKLEQIYTQYELQETAVPHKLVFVEECLIDVFVNYKEYLSKDTLMMHTLQRKYESWCVILHKCGIKLANDIKSQLIKIYTGGKKQGNIVDYHQLIKDMFRIIIFFIKHKKDKIDNQIPSITTFISDLKDIVTCSINILAQESPIYNFESEQILDPDNMKEFMSYIKQVKLAQKIIDLILHELKKARCDQLQEASLSIRKMINRSKSACAKLFSIYEEQVENMLLFLENFEFSEILKPSLPQKDIEQGLSQFYTFYHILKILQRFLHQHIITKEYNKYNFNKLSKILRKKFYKYVRDLRNNIFEIKNENSTERLNLFVKILFLMHEREQKKKFITAVKVEKIREHLDNMLRLKSSQNKVLIKAEHHEHEEINWMEMTNEFLEGKINNRKQKEQRNTSSDSDDLKNQEIGQKALLNLIAVKNGQSSTQ